MIKYMKKYKGFIISFIIVALIIVASYLDSNKSDSSYSPPTKHVKSEYAITTEMKEKITPDYLENIVKEIVVPHFETIDSIRYAHPEPEKISRDLKIKYKEWCNEYHAWIGLCGWVYGKAKSSSKQRYYFSIYDNITNKNIDNPYVDLKRELKIHDDNDIYIYYKGEDIIKANEDHKKWKDDKKKEDAKRDFKIDGIRVKYSYQCGASYVYVSEKELTPQQVLKAINQIGENKVNMIQFCVENIHYADYVYSTQCIIYKGSGDIYKVINGKPVKAV